MANWRDRGYSKAFSSANPSLNIYIQKIFVWDKHCIHLRHLSIMVLIDERIDCLPAVLLTPTLWFLFFAQLGQCIQLYLHSCLPFHVFERKQLLRRSLGCCNPSPSRQPYGYQSSTGGGRERWSLSATYRRHSLQNACSSSVVARLRALYFRPHGLSPSRQSQVMPNPLNFTL